MCTIKRNDEIIRDWVIYKLISPSGRIYIGKASDFKQRMRHYKSVICKKQPMLYRSLKKYGFDAHVLEKLECFSGINSLAIEREIFWIKKYKSNVRKYPEMNGLNLTDGGEGTTGFKFNEVQLKRLSEAHIGQVSSKKGIPLNEQTKAKISAKLKGVKHPPERGRRKFSDEQKLELSNRSKGNTFRKGQKYSPEIIKKMVSVMTEKIGRPVIRYDFNYNILGEYASVSEASRETGIPAHSIYKAVTVKANQRKFIFKYKDESGYKKVILQRRVFKRQEIKVA